MTVYVLEVHLHGVLFQGLEKVPFIAHIRSILLWVKKCYVIVCFTLAVVQSHQFLFNVWVVAYYYQELLKTNAAESNHGSGDLEHSVI